MHLTPPRSLSALRRDRRGVAMLEFALALPLFLGATLYSIEAINFALQQYQLSQAALTLSDNVSRVGVDTNLARQQLRESDINEVIGGLRRQTDVLKLTTYGRVTISSLEVRNGAQWIHWQRCVGRKSGIGYDSSFGIEGDGGTTGTHFRGMGTAAQPVTAPPDAAVIFVELNYEYQPMISGYFLGNRKLQQTASFIVRDNRDLSAGVIDAEPHVPVRMTCNRYTA